MNTIVVTGAAGFVGSNLVSLFLKKGYTVIALDCKDNPYERLDLTNEKLNYFNIFEKSFSFEILKRFSPDTFYHLGWKGSAGPLRADVDCQIDNATNALKMMEAASSIGCKRFILAGTIMEFETLQQIYEGNSIDNVNYTYGLGKVLAHSLCSIFANKNNIEFICAYITNTYGVGEVSPRLINSSIKKYLNNETLIFSSGTQNYDFIYIDDTVNAFYLIGEKGKNHANYVIGSGDAKPLKSFLMEMIEVLGPNTKYSFGNEALKGVSLDIDVFSTSNFVDDCGFKPEVSFKEGIERTYDWIKKGEGNND